MHDCNRHITLLITSHGEDVVSTPILVECGYIDAFFFSKFNTQQMNKDKALKFENEQCHNRMTKKSRNLSTFGF